MPEKLRVWGSANILGQMAITGDVTANKISATQLSVSSTATFNGGLTSLQGLMFDNNNGFKLSTAVTGTATTNYFSLGKSAGIPESICGNPSISQWMINSGGGFISSQINPSIAPLVKASINMYCAPWNGSGFIDVEGKDQAGNENNALFVNYFVEGM